MAALKAHQLAASCVAVPVAIPIDSPCEVSQTQSDKICNESLQDFSACRTYTSPLLVLQDHLGCLITTLVNFFVFNRPLFFLASEEIKQLQLVCQAPKVASGQN